ncbi:translation initiation factor IF-2 [Triticum aestivum]|uniref:translation initiation factor IF-2 n=1 Tax=Triticum aestivum TaxID=4565 RepID=UPI001D010DB7|nr:translation initiation factor IF-2-like [Triticum aestivum]
MEGFCLVVDSVRRSLLLEPLHRSTFSFECNLLSLLWSCAGGRRQGPPGDPLWCPPRPPATSARTRTTSPSSTAAAAPGARAANGAASAAAGQPRLRPPRPGARRRRSKRRPCSRAMTLTRPSATSMMASLTSSPGCSSWAWSTCAWATRPRSGSPPSEAIARLEPRVPRHPPQALCLPRLQPAPPRGPGAAPQGARACRALHERLQVGRAALRARGVHGHAPVQGGVLDVLLSSYHGVSDGDRHPVGLAEEEGETWGLKKGSRTILMPSSSHVD